MHLQGREVSQTKNTKDIYLILSVTSNFAFLPQNLTEGEVWDAANACSHVTKLLLAGWIGVAEKPLRGISIILGENLQLVDLSDSPVTDSMVVPI